MCKSVSMSVIKFKLPTESEYTFNIYLFIEKIKKINFYKKGKIIWLCNSNIVVTITRIFYHRFLIIIQDNDSYALLSVKITLQILFFFVFLSFLGPHLWHVEVPRLQVQGEL